MKQGYAVLGLLLAAWAGRGHAADCAAVAGSVKVAVRLEAPLHPKASALTLLVEYPPSVAIPGSGAEPSVRERVHTQVANATLAVNDTGRALRLVVARATGVGTGAIGIIELDRCKDASTPGIEEFHCRVEGAGSASGPVPGTSCSVTLS